MKTSRYSILSTIVCGVCCMSLQAAPEKKAAAPAQKSFDTPELAVAGLVEAASAFDIPALKAILGEGASSLVNTEDPVMDKERAQEFVAKTKIKQAIEIDPKKPDRALLTVGEDAYPLPVPIIRQKGKWSFDTKAGLQEILNRIVGTNELDAIEICRGYVEAQYEYAAKKHDGSIVNQYAQRVISTPGKQDGLAWQNADGTWDGPVGEGVAKALAQGYTKKDKPQPFHGYHFKILKGQGAAAPFGKMDFMLNGAMIGGFALAAAPAEYKVTGVKTFIVSHAGVVYEKDMGANTLAEFEKMELFNPDKTWQVTEDEW